MKNASILKILFFLLLMLSFNTQTTNATTVDLQPVYINGGGDGLLRDLYSYISAASLPQSDDVEGKCFFTFAISKDGSIDIETIKPIRKITLPDEYVNAAKEAIKHLGKFEPGKQYNAKEERWESLRVHYNLVVAFPIPSKYLTSE